MRYVEGGELYRQMRALKRFDEEHAKFYVVQIALALGHLHEKNIVYNDLKAENCLLQYDGYICLTDFGLAMQMNVNEKDKRFCGTPAYMAPEILNRAGHTYKADWWALGILTYEMIVGNTPFYTGGTNMHKLARCVQVRPVIFPDPKRHSIHMTYACKDFIK